MFAQTAVIIKLKKLFLWANNNYKKEADSGFFFVLIFGSINIMGLV